MLKLLDHIGPNIQLTIQKKTIFKSDIGGVMTVFMTFIFIGAFIGFGIDIIQKSKPNVRFNRIKNKEVPYFEFTDNNLLLTIYDQYTDQQYPEFERMFKISFDYFDYFGNGTQSIKFKNPLEKCGQKAIKQWESSFRFDPKYFYCFPENSKVELRGVASQGIFTGLRLQVDYCSNNTDLNKGPIKTNCLPKNEVKEIVSKYRIQMNYLIGDTLVDTSNYDEPLKGYILSDYVNTDANSWSRLKIDFKQIRVQTDTGFFLQNMEYVTSSGIESIKFESFHNPNTDTVFSHWIQFSDWVDVYERDYIKLQGIFAMMGGFINFSLIVLRLTMTFVTKTQIVDIFNKTYFHCDFEERNTKKLNDSQILKSVKTI
jgi:hypothetical protein